MRSAITISLVPETKGGPFVFSEGLSNGCARAAELGFDAIEIFPKSGADIDRVALRTLLEEHGLQVAAMGTGAGWVVHKLALTNADPEVRTKARDFVREIIETAGYFGAPAIIGSMQGRWEGAVGREQALRYLGEALAELATSAAKHNVPLLYEPLNRYETNLFNRIGDAAEWLLTLEAKNVRILADLFHMNIEEVDSAQALRNAGSAVGHVHFADSNRRAIGMGQTAISPLMKALRDIGYTGYLSAEIFPLPDPVAAAKQTIAAFRQFVGSR